MMSLILRHNPNFIKASLDQNGWLSIDELRAGINKKGLQLDENLLFEIVDNNIKKRFALSEDKKKIRANQGHTVDVDVELEQQQPPQFLYHGTVEKFITSIRDKGLSKMKRQHVHLSSNIETASNVGSRRGKPIILKIEAERMHQDGLIFYLSENKVW